MSFSVSYTYRSCSIRVTATEQYGYYRVICRTGTIADGSGTVICDDTLELSYGDRETVTFSVDSETTYTANVLVYDENHAYIGAMGAKQFTTPAEPTPTYTIRATITYDANGGAGAPSQQTLTATTTSTYGYASGTVSGSEPTRSGYRFTGWMLAGTSTTYEPGDSITLYATTSGESYTLVAQWTVAESGATIYAGASTWNHATPTVWTGAQWVDLQEAINGNSEWP